MGDKTGIAWTNATWNPLAGCSVVSPGCTNCYAMKMAARIERMGKVPHYRGLTTPSKKGAVWNGTVRMAPDSILLKPLHWKRPRRIFVNSMSDLFHEAVSDEDIDRVFAVMALTPHHTYQVLTKRAQRMRDYMAAPSLLMRIDAAMDLIAPAHWHDREVETWPLPHVWLGVSAEDQARADERIPFLLDTPAAVRWISAEPLLGPIDLTNLDHTGTQRAAGAHGISAIWTGNAIGRPWLDWVVAGGESGPGARPMHPDWARNLRDQCAAAGVPFFFKQWGAWGHVNAQPSGTPGHYAFGDGAGPMLVTDFYPRQFSLFGSTALLERVGKRAAGHLLDGVEHFAWPEVR